MGVPSLLRFLGSATSEVHVSSFSGQCVAVDASCWLHRGAISCASKLLRGEPTDDYLRYPLAMVRLLEGQGVTPLLVFDGAKLPMKARTDLHRARQRAEQGSEARELLEDGGKGDASSALHRSVVVTTAMAQRLIEALKSRGVRYIVAPYEADAQLTFLVLHGHCCLAVSEDSDLLAYGCPHILFKLSRDGHGRLASFENLQFATEAATGRLLFDGAWRNEWDEWRARLFRDMCILAGCDYLAGMPGVGVKTAHAALRAHRSTEAAIRALLPADEAAEEGRSLRRSRGGNTPHGVLASYLECFKATCELFEHQLVWDPTARAAVPLRPRLDAHSPHAALCGPPMSEEAAASICEAKIDPITLLPLGRSQSCRAMIPANSSSPTTPPRRVELTSRFFSSHTDDLNAPPAAAPLDCSEQQSYLSECWENRRHTPQGELPDIARAMGHKQFFNRMMQAEHRPSKRSLSVPDISSISADFLIKIRRRTSPHLN
ncbi:MAG: hypothetical protein SGPRY_014109 [Prymnesium sp.]